jgi:ligand-binding sensor domain-containing protein
VVYAAQNGKRWDDFGTYLWRSPDQGLTWNNIGAGIPCGPINVVHEDPQVSGLLYVGTDLGVYVSLDDGQTWEVLGAGLPNTFVHDLVVHPRDGVLLAATHGRGVWQLDVRTLQSPEDEAEEEPEPEDGRGRASRRR